MGKIYQLLTKLYAKGFDKSVTNGNDWNQNQYGNDYTGYKSQSWIINQQIKIKINWFHQVYHQWMKKINTETTLS